MHFWTRYFKQARIFKILFDYVRGYNYIFIDICDCLGQFACISTILMRGPLDPSYIGIRVAGNRRQLNFR